MEESPMKLAWLALAAPAALLLAGCGKSETAPAAPPADAPAAKPADAPAAPPADAPAAKPADAPAAKAYPLDTCVVSGEKLGSMGPPVVITHEGTEVRFCCKDCVEKFNKEPAKYLAKLKEAGKK
jgi:hypothetical protein